MRFNSGPTTCLLALALFGAAAACSGADDAREPEADAGELRAAVDGGCPASEPTYGAACSGGALRCRLHRHGDCVAPACPSGCKYLGIAPGAQITTGVEYFAVCRDGIWTQSSEGSCSLNKEAAICDCDDQDAGL